MLVNEDETKANLLYPSRMIMFSMAHLDIQLHNILQDISASDHEPIF